MAVTDLFAGEIAAELLKMLVTITKRAFFCKSTAEQLIRTIQQLLPIIQEIKYSGVELPQTRQYHIDRLSVTLRDGLELAAKVLSSSRWNVYRSLQLAKKMDKLEEAVSRFMTTIIHAHILADVHHLRFEYAERFDRMEGSTKRIEQRLGSSGIEEAVRRAEECDKFCDDNLVHLGYGMDVGKKTVKEMIMGCGSLWVLGIRGIGGSGKTTLAREIRKDDTVRCYFKERILFLTVSQSPNVEHLKKQIWGLITRNTFHGSDGIVPPWTQLNTDRKIQPINKLVILDDVWSLSVLDQLIFKIPGLKTLVVSRFKFPVVEKTYELELLSEMEAISLFCYFAFGQNSIPITSNENLVKQVVNECKGLPLALKVIGASLRGQPEIFWTSANHRLTRSEPICESHETKVLERLAISIDYLPNKVRECFLDLASFPEDKKIPLDVLINVWSELHGLHEDEAFAILVELSDKNLLTLVKDARFGDMYSSYYEICVCQHDVLRDLAHHLSSRGRVNERSRLLMPKRENCTPKEWERNIDRPFNAQIVSIHTGEMKEWDWSDMEFPKVEVLVINFSSGNYSLPGFIKRMPKLRALIVINYGSSVAEVHNLSMIFNLYNLRSIWFEKLSLPQVPELGAPLKIRKISLVLCKKIKGLNWTGIDFQWLLPCISEFTMDHCESLSELPPSICWISNLQSLSITNCGLRELPQELGNLRSLQILRIYACPCVKALPAGICELAKLKYLDISQCVNLECLPDRFGGLVSLEKIDMRECNLIKNIPNSCESLRSLHHVICEESVFCFWKELEKSIPNLHVQVPEECFDLDFLSE